MTRLSDRLETAMKAARHLIDMDDEWGGAGWEQAFRSFRRAFEQCDAATIIAALRERGE